MAEKITTTRLSHTLDAKAKNRIGRARGIKQKIDREHNVRMWYLIQKTVKDPNSPAVLRVQTVTNGKKTSTYTKQPDIERVIQKQCKSHIGFRSQQSRTHSELMKMNYQNTLINSIKCSADSFSCKSPGSILCTLYDILMLLQDHTITLTFEQAVQ